MYFDQTGYDVRCEWGEAGVRALAPHSDIVIIVDVLSFCTSVEIATSRGAIVYPYRWKDESAIAFAAAQGAVLARAREARDGFSLSPASLLGIPAGTKLVLPSPNGSALTIAASAPLTIAGSLRNCRAVAERASRSGGTIAVIPAGERWPDGSLRPAIEDLIGAGAIIASLSGSRSPESEAAVAAFEQARSALSDVLMRCASGRELVERGFARDVELAGELDVSRCVPVLNGGAYSRG